MYYTQKDVERAVRAVIYIRYSSHRQTDSFSIEYQIQECMRYIERKGYKFIRQYVDEATTGKKVAGRDSFDEMIRDAEVGKFDTIIVFSFSRSFRNTRDALNYNHELREKCGVVFESVIEQIDMNNPHGKFSGTNLFAMHELQADIIAGHVKAGMYIAAQQGYFLGGTVPYGYKLYGTGELTRGKERKKYEINESEAKHIIKMFELYADNFSLTYIQEQMKNEGVKGRRGGIIGLQTIARILKNDFYIGTRNYEIEGYEPLKIPNAVPAIIDAETWNKVQLRHQANKLPTPRKKGKRLYSLTGKIYCAKCGAHMFGTYKGDKRSENWHYAYYHCATKKSRRDCDSKNIRKDLIDKYVLSQIKEHILNPEAMDVIADKIVGLAGSAPNEIETKTRKLNKRRKELAGYVKELLKEKLAGKITQDILDEMTFEYNGEIAEIDIELMQLDNARNTAITKETVLNYLQRMFDEIDEENEEIRKNIFDKLVEKIVVYDDRVELFLIVYPYTRYGDKLPQGQPHVVLSNIITRYALNKL